MKKKLAVVFRILWFVSMVLFVAIFLGFGVYKNDTRTYQGIAIAWLVSIGFGIIFYLLYFFFKTKSVKNSNKAFKQVVIQGVIGLVLCVVALPVAAKGLQIAGITKPTASPTPTNFIDNYKLFGMVNDFRVSQKLSAVSQDDETCKVAQKRLDSYFWQTNLSIDNYKDVCPTCNSLSVAESKDNYNLDSILSSWKENKDTLNTLQTKYKYGCVKVSGGNVTLVMVNKNIPAAKAVVVTNPDPITDCVSSAPNCNGSSIKARKSQCSRITCCQIGNSWSVYPSSEECTKAQGGSTPVTPIQVTKPSTGLNYYCYDNTYKNWYYTSSGEQCNLDNLKSACKGMVKSTYDLCMDNCLSQAHQDSSTCIYTYGSSSPEYQQCMNVHDSKFQSCMDACAKPYQENSAKCN